jgi:hypothetical protein
VLELRGLGVLTPDRSNRLVEGLDLTVSVTPTRAYESQGRASRVVIDARICAGVVLPE